MFYRIFILLFIIFTPLFSLELNTKVELNEMEKAFLKKHPKITLTSGISFEPFFVVNKDGTISGHDKEIIDLIEKKTGLKIDVKLGVWKEVQEKAKKKEFDGLACAGYSKDREIYYNKSIPYVQFTTLVYVKKGNPKKIYKIEDLYGKKIAIQKGNTLFENFLKQNVKNSNEIEIIYYGKIPDLIKAVVSNEVDFTIYDETAFYVAKKMGLAQLIDGAFSLGEIFDVMFWVRKDFPEAISIINKGIKAISEKEKLEIRNRWFYDNKNKFTFLTQKEKAYLNKKEKIKMCIDPNWMPFIGIKNGKHIGISADFMKLIEEQSPIPIEIVKAKNWSESLNFAKEKKCDILPITMKTKTRENYLNFTTPYINIPLILAIHKNSTFIDDIKNLKDKRIAIVKDFAFSEILKNRYPNLNIVEVNSIKDGLKKVESGKVFGFADTLASISFYSQDELIKDIKIGGKFNESYELSIGVRSDDRELLNIFEKLLSHIDEDEKQHIINKWIAIKYEKAFDYSLFWKILAIIFIILTFIIYRHYILNRVNRELEKRIKEEIEKSREKDNLIFQQNKMASLGEMIGNIEPVKTTV